MFQSFFRSWKLVKESWSVLQSDRSLTLFPFVSLLLTLLSIGVFVVVLQLAGVLPLLFISQGRSPAIFNNKLFQLLLLILCFVTYSIVTFTDTGLIFVALKNLHGEQISIREGFAFALKRMHQILLYSLISTAAGLIIGDIESSKNPIVRALGYTMSFAWDIATFLVIPIFIVENSGPMKAVGQSYELLKKTWGDQLVATITMNVFFNVVSLIVLCVIGIPAILLFMIMESFIPLVVGVAIISIIAATLALFHTALNGVFKAELYMYATTGNVGRSFDADTLKHAFQSRTDSAT